MPPSLRHGTRRSESEFAPLPDLAGLEGGSYVTPLSHAQLTWQREHFNSA